jgi:hypothetical protein
MGNHIKEDEMGKSCGMYGEKRNENMILIGKPEDKRRLG